MVKRSSQVHSFHRYIVSFLIIFILENRTSFYIMSGFIPKILVLAHSFFRGLRDDLNAHAQVLTFIFPSRDTFSYWAPVAELRKKLLKHDLSFVQQYKPYVLILEICINDLSICAPEVVGSKTDDLACFFRDKYEVRVVGVCQVINRNVA